ncbi:hypothetical protein LWI28_015797 [Acer negundo]|uniref:Uncharacterized protein n=1 Tax=Acer negundo TaxID=4023 RepID=A0AAD5JL22_ACENE|nr:hypothetical protein LWI28_015797 [Acer negundo]
MYAFYEISYLNSLPPPPPISFFFLDSSEFLQLLEIADKYKDEEMMSVSMSVLSWTWFYKCMNRRCSLGGTLIPTNNNIDRVCQVARQFEELDPFVEEIGNRDVQHDRVIQAKREVQDDQDVQDRQGARKSPPGSLRRGLDDDIRIMREFE